LKPEQPNNHIGYFPETPGQQPPRRRTVCNAETPSAHAQNVQPEQHTHSHASHHMPQGYYPSSAPRAASKKPFHWRKYLPVIVFVVCICVFVTSAALLINYFSSIAASRNASAQLNELYSAAIEQSAQPTETPTLQPTALPSATPAAFSPAPTALQAVHQTASSAAELWPSTYPNNPSLRVSPNFYQLQGQNEDIVGWIKIEDVLEEPVVQRDNKYYLTHNVLKDRSVTGALFLDETCNLKTVPTQMLIHGHNMKEGAMFGALKKYKVKDASFYREHPFIDFNTIYENGRYVIFAVAEVDIRSGKPDYLPFWHNTRFASADAFMEYVERAKLLSYYRCNVDVQPGDRLLALSTCTSIDDNKRLIIMARKLRENENELELNIGIYSTSDR